MKDEKLKKDVASYWNKGSCGTEFAEAPKFTREYYDQIEEHRYTVEPEIFSFAQFTRFRGLKMLEVGVGAGTDFLQWIRAGALAHGIDMTEEAIAHVKHRLDIYGLAAQEFKVADAENLPYPDETFDLIYSWGVIHHSPDTIKALSEIVRCAKKGGAIKIMIYNKWSLYSFYKYLWYGLFRGRPFRSISDIMYHHQESPGTKVYTISEVKKILSTLPVDIKSVQAPVTYYDLFGGRSFLHRAFAYVLSFLCGPKKCGWFLTMDLRKKS